MCWWAAILSLSQRMGRTSDQYECDRAAILSLSQAFLHITYLVLQLSLSMISRASYGEGRGGGEGRGEEHQKTNCNKSRTLLYIYIHTYVYNMYNVVHIYFIGTHIVDMLHSVARCPIFTPYARSLTPPCPISHTPMPDLYPLSCPIPHPLGPL